MGVGSRIIQRVDGEVENYSRGRVGGRVWGRELYEGSSVGSRIIHWGRVLSARRDRGRVLYPTPSTPGSGSGSRESRISNGLLLTPCFLT